jgi:hypothetical protein
MKQKGFLLPLPLSLVLFMVLACGSTPEAPAPIEPAPQAAPAQAAPVQTVIIPEPVVPPTVQVFDPESISEEHYEAVREEVRALIADLNMIIRARNYDAWVTHLSDSYFAEISSRDFLEERTEELYRRDQTVARNLGRDPRMVQRRVLRTPMDFFNHVVVPSRSNDRVDDIDFVSENRVIAYTIDSRGNRLILYNLERIDGRWRITE